MTPWSRDLARSYDELKSLYVHYHISMAIKLGRMVTCHEGLLAIKSHDILIKWSYYKVISQTKIIISSIPQCLWPPNMAGWWVTLSGFHPYSYSTQWQRSLARSRDKLKPLYLHYYSPYSHQTWQGDDISCGVPTQEVTWSFNYVF